MRETYLKQERSRLYGNEPTKDNTTAKSENLFADDASKVFDVSLDPEEIQKLRNADKFQSTPRSPKIDPLIMTNLGKIISIEQDPSNPNSHILKYDSGTEYRGSVRESNESSGENAETVPSGFGTFKFSNGDQYTGSLGLRCKGEYVHANGVAYSGQFYRFQKWGIATEEYPSGMVYRGMFRKGVKDGKGVMNFANGDVYEGQFVDDIRRHIGVYRHHSGEQANGDWNGDQLNGTGQYTLQSGKMIKSLFNNSRIKF